MEHLIFGRFLEYLNNNLPDQESFSINEEVIKMIEENIHTLEPLFVKICGDYNGSLRELIISSFACGLNVGLRYSKWKGEQDELLSMFRKSD